MEVPQQAMAKLLEPDQKPVSGREIPRHSYGTSLLVQEFNPLIENVRPIHKRARNEKELLL